MGRMRGRGMGGYKGVVSKRRRFGKFSRGEDGFLDTGINSDINDVDRTIPQMINHAFIHAARTGVLRGFTDRLGVLEIVGVLLALK